MSSPSLLPTQVRSIVNPAGFDLFVLGLAAPFATSVLGLAYPALTLDGRVTWNPWRWVEEQVGVKAPGSTHAPNVLLTHDTCGDSNNRVMVQTVDRHGDVAGASNTNLKKKKNKK